MLQWRPENDAEPFRVRVRLARKQIKQRTENPLGQTEWLWRRSCKVGSVSPSCSEKKFTLEAFCGSLREEKTYLILFLG